jgi:hypothetical protein
MVKRGFEDLKVDLWVYRGKLGTTRTALCLHHDAAHLGSEILDALNEIKDAGTPSRRTLTFRVSTRPRSLRCLRLVLENESDSLKVMSITHDADTATIAMTPVGWQLVYDAVAAWLAGGEDFGVSPARAMLKPKQFGARDKESVELWFWGPDYYAP